MSRVGYLVRTYWFDVVVTLLAIEAMVEVSVRAGSTSAPATTLWFCVPAIGVMVLPIFARRRYPFGAPAAYWLLAAGFSFVDGRLVTSMTSVFVLGMAGAFLLGDLRDGLRARLGLAVVLGCAAIIVYNAPDHSTSELVFIPLLFGICWLAGYALREREREAEAAKERAARAEQERETAARLAVAEERARIARELHDIVAHAMSVMVLQVGAVRHKLPETLEEDANALRGVEQTGRSALAEMRRLLGAMRHESDGLELEPQPGLASLGALAEKVGLAGLQVDVHVEGDPVPLPGAIDLSAYRIVQEGLTNALKHGQARRADVTVRYGNGDLQIEVRDDGNGTSPSDGLGHGLIGVRERVKIYGGEMTAGPASDGGFVLSTRLPLRGDPS